MRQPCFRVCLDNCGNSILQSTGSSRIVRRSIIQDHSWALSATHCPKFVYKMQAAFALIQFCRPAFPFGVQFCSLLYIISYYAAHRCDQSGLNLWVFRSFPQKDFTRNVDYAIIEFAWGCSSAGRAQQSHC